MSGTVRGFLRGSSDEARNPEVRLDCQRPALSVGSGCGGTTEVLELGSDLGKVLLAGVWASRRRTSFIP